MSQGAPPPLFTSPTADWPLHGLIDDARDAIAALVRGDARFAVATLVEADGPSPRPLGAQMAIGPAGVAGYVSGGCVEASLALIGQDVVTSGAAQLVRFGKNSRFVDVRLTCGSAIEVLIEPGSPADATWAAVLEARDARKPIVRTASLHAAADIRAAVDGDLACWREEGDRFARRYDPPLRLIVCGRDPVALAIAAAAQSVSMQPILVRRLGPSTAPTGFSADYIVAEPRDALIRTGLDPWTAVVTTTHDLDEDHQTLCAALPSRAFYVGALGSRRKLAERMNMLERGGVDWVSAKRLHAPVGLDIGAATPGEIALSIVADIVRVHRARA